MLGFRVSPSLPAQHPRPVQTSVAPSHSFPQAFGKDEPVRTKTGGAKFSGIHSPPHHLWSSPFSCHIQGAGFLRREENLGCATQGVPCRQYLEQGLTPSGQSQTGFPSLGVGFVMEPPPPRCVLAHKSHSCLVLMALNT